MIAVPPLHWQDLVGWLKVDICFCIRVLIWSCRQTPDTLLVMTCILFLLSGKMHRLYLVENHRQVRDCCAVIGRLLNGRFWQICTISALACCNILEKFFLLQTLIVLTPKFLLKEGLPYNYQRVSRSEKQRVLLIICWPNDWKLPKITSLWFCVNGHKHRK